MAMFWSQLVVRLLGEFYFGCKNGSRGKERKRENFWVDRKTCKKKRIATDLYYYYGEIDYKINASLATAYELYK